MRLFLDTAQRCTRCPHLTHHCCPGLNSATLACMAGGWRRTHLHKVRLWRLIIHAGFDLLSLDANLELAWNPVPAIQSMPLQPAGPSWHVKLLEVNRVDVLAVHDGPRNKLVNIGLLWVRSTPYTTKLMSRTENRTWAGWDQMIFNEELNFNLDFQSIGCCFSAMLKRATRTQVNGDAVQKTTTGAFLRRSIEGADICNSNVPIAASAPPHSRIYTLNHWSHGMYNEPSKLNHRREGRCTKFHDPKVWCIGLDASQNSSS